MRCGPSPSVFDNLQLFFITDAVACDDVIFEVRPWLVFINIAKHAVVKGSVVLRFVLKPRIEICKELCSAIKGAYVSFEVAKSVQTRTYQCSAWNPSERCRATDRQETSSLKDCTVKQIGQSKGAKFGDSFRKAGKS